MRLHEEFKLYETMWESAETVTEAADYKTFYITYQDSYSDSFTPYFITDSNDKSIAHWPKDVRHYYNYIGDDGGTYVYRAEASVAEADANILSKVVNKPTSIKYKDAWIEAEKVVDRLARANKLKVLDDACDYSI
jgi:hypothetical protein